MVKIILNEPLKDDQFALAQPPGSQLVRLDSDQHTAEQKPTTQSSTHLR
jgi:hypothetical protein